MKNRVRQVIWVCFAVAVLLLYALLPTGKGKKADGEEGAKSTATVAKPLPEVVPQQEVCPLLCIPLEHCKLEICDSVRPSRNDESIVLCVAAAFTKDRHPKFSHNRIAGVHLVHGVLYNGYKDAHVNGSFAFFDGEHHFALKEDRSLARKAQQRKGAFFMQNMVIFNHQEVEEGKMYEGRQDKVVTWFRCLAEKDGKLYVYQSRQQQSFRSFVDDLLATGVTNALYLDMGGWKHSWYRDANGRLVIFFPEETDSKYQTNWLVGSR